MADYRGERAHLYETKHLPPQETWRANVVARVGELDESHRFVEIGTEAMILVIATPEGLRAGAVRFAFSD